MHQVAESNSFGIKPFSKVGSNDGASCPPCSAPSCWVAPAAPQGVLAAESLLRILFLGAKKVAFGIQNRLLISLSRLQGPRAAGATGTQTDLGSEMGVLHHPLKQQLLGHCSLSPHGTHMSLGSQARPCGLGRAQSILCQGEQMAPWGRLAESLVPSRGRVTLAGAGGVIPAQGKDNFRLEYISLKCHFPF